MQADSIIEFHTLTAAERRMLLELLVSERAGEDALFVGTLFDRDQTAGRLCALRMSQWLDTERLVFTYYGRQVAERLADRIVDRKAYRDMTC